MTPIPNSRSAVFGRSARQSLVIGAALLSSSGTVLAAGSPHSGFVPNTLVVSRIQFNADTNPARSGETYPAIFNDPNVPGIQGSIFLDSYWPVPNSPRLGSLPLTGLSVNGTPITTSFSSKSEGALNLSVDGRFLTYLGYVAVPGLEGVSNSYTTDPNAQLSTHVGPFYDRAAALIKFDGSFSVTAEPDAFSGDNPRAATTVDGQEFYMAGNADSTEYGAAPFTGPGTTIGVRFGAPGSPVSIRLGTYLATDRTDESTKKHVKDNNWRGIAIFNNNLYVSKGSGGNGDDGVFQVLNGTGNGVPAGGTSNQIVPLFGVRATNPVTKASSFLTPFGFWFANPTTLYVADEGNATISTTDANGNPVTQLVSDPLAGLQKWVLVSNVWTLEYVIQDGLQLNQPANVPGYPVPTYTTGLRNLTGRVNDDGTVTIYAITAQYSTISGGEPDPTRLVAVKDAIAATALPRERDADQRQADFRGNDGDGFDAHHGGDANDGRWDEFYTLQSSRAGEVFRGVAFAPQQ
ncbi:MAG TPA: hypothetical protein VMU87_08495 [Stellaceae bacterium]|nr:hypothetical protein [Stellaceae bacterium]